MTVARAQCSPRRAALPLLIRLHQLNLRSQSIAHHAGQFYSPTPATLDRWLREFPSNRFSTSQCRSRSSKFILTTRRRVPVQVDEQVQARSLMIPCMMSSASSNDGSCSIASFDRIMQHRTCIAGLQCLLCRLQGCGYLSWIRGSKSCNRALHIPWPI